jgi:hypothetical protein
MKPETRRRRELIQALDAMMANAKKWEVEIHRDPALKDSTDGWMNFVPGDVTEIHITVTAKPAKAKRRKAVAD